MIPHSPNVVSTHSRLKAAGKRSRAEYDGIGVSTHSRLKAAGLGGGMGYRVGLFQHTAA